MIIRSLINLNLEAHDLQDDIAPIVEGGPTPRHPDPGIGTHTLAHPDGEPYDHLVQAVMGVGDECHNGAKARLPDEMV